jgi:hypothetical protein
LAISLSTITPLREERERLDATAQVLSASWNPSVNGSALGLDEFKENVPLFMQRFKND